MTDIFKYGKHEDFSPKRLIPFPALMRDGSCQNQMRMFTSIKNKTLRRELTSKSEYALFFPLSPHLYFH